MIDTYQADYYFDKDSVFGEIVGLKDVIFILQNIAQL
jgi:hypothetical protein